MSTLGSFASKSTFNPNKAYSYKEHTHTWHTGKYIHAKAYINTPVVHP